MRLANRVALVIGGANGIGEASARLFAREGASVLIGDLDAERGNNVAREIAGKGGEAGFLACNCMETSTLREAVEATVSKFGQIDILLYAAGTMEQVNFFDIDEEHFARILATNLTGAMFASQAAAKHMLNRGRGGSLINIASVGGALASMNTLAYGASKAGLIHLTKSLSVALAAHNIRANSVGPGSVETRMLAGMRAEDRTAMLSRTPLGRFARPEEIANVALFLASDESSYVTGQVIWADGGRQALNRTVPVKA